MIRGGFLSDAERREIRALMRGKSGDVRVSRRANAIYLLDKGWSCERVGEALDFDDATIRSWYSIAATSSRDLTAKLKS